MYSPIPSGKCQSGAILSLIELLHSLLRSPFCKQVGDTNADGGHRVIPFEKGEFLWPKKRPNPVGPGQLLGFAFFARRKKMRDEMKPMDALLLVQGWFEGLVKQC